MGGKWGDKMGKWDGDGMGQGERWRSGEDVNFAQSNQSFPHRPPQTPTKNIYPLAQKRAPKISMFVLKQTLQVCLGGLKLLSYIYYVIMRESNQKTQSDENARN